MTRLPEALSLGLVNDLIEVIAYYTPPFSTMKLITLNNSIVGRLGYDKGPGPNGLWCTKVLVEQKGIVRPDVLNWYVYYRTINRRLEGGKAYLSRGPLMGHGQETLITDRVVGAADYGDLLVLTPEKIVRAIFNPDLDRAEAVRRPEVESLDSLTRDGKDGVLILSDGTVDLDPFTPGTWAKTSYLSGVYYGLSRDRCVQRLGYSTIIEIPGPGRIVDVLSLYHSAVMVTDLGTCYGIGSLDGRAYPLSLNIFPVSVSGCSDWSVDVYQTGRVSIRSWTRSNGGELSQSLFELSFDIPNIVRAVAGPGHQGVYFLDADGRVYQHTKTGGITVLDIPPCCDLIKLANGYAYVTVD